MSKIDKILKNHPPIEYEYQIVGEDPENEIQASGSWTQLRCERCNEPWPCKAIEPDLTNWDNLVEAYTSDLGNNVAPYEPRPVDSVYDPEKGERDG